MVIKFEYNNYIIIYYMGNSYCKYSCINSEGTDYPIYDDNTETPPNNKENQMENHACNTNTNINSSYKNANKRRQIPMEWDIH